MKQRTQEELILLLYKTPRMYWQKEIYPCNFLKGLYDLITTNLNGSMTMAEIGSYAAVSSHLFAEHVKHIYCIDQWKAYHEVEEQHIIEGERLFDNFLKHSNNVTKIKLSSVEASKTFENRSLDFVYIDADHSYEAVTEDIHAWFSKIKQNGLIGGHDYHHPAVQRAVKDIFKNEVIQTYEDTSWLIHL